MTKAATQSKQSRARALRKLEDLQPDPQNPNKGTQRGASMIDWSLSQLGAARSLVADSDGVVLCGNKTLEAAATKGFPIKVVQTDGQELVVVQRTDVRLNGNAKERKLARQISIADNRTSQVSYDPDVEMLLAHKDSGVDISDMFNENEIVQFLAKVGNADEDTSERLGELEYRIIVSCKSEAHQVELLERLEAEGLQCQALIS